MKKLSVLLAVFMVLMLAIPAMAGTKVDGNQVTFTFKAPDANMVYLSGNFNAWSPTGDKMTKGADGVWTVTIKLKPGTYQYKFVVDGKWTTDEEAASLVDDGFGGKNSVLVVKAAGASDNARIDKLEQEIATLKEAQGGFQFHGYARSGILMNDKGGAMTGAINNNGAWSKYRLGNEADTYIENSLCKVFTLDDGSRMKAEFMWAHSDGSDTDWEGGGVALRQSYVEAGNLPFAPDLTFWAGRRYYGRSDIHLTDFYWRDMSGIGAGVQGISLGGPKLAVAFLTKSNPDQQNVPDVGQFMVKALDFRLSEISAGPGSLEFEAALYSAEAPSGAETPEGYHFDAMYSMGNFFGFAEGSSTVAFQYGKGMGNGFNLNPWGAWGADDAFNKSNRTRLLGYGVWQISPEFEMQPLFLYQLSDNGQDSNPNSTWYSLGVRPVYHVNKNFAWQFELGYDVNSADGQDKDATLTKLTIAPTLTLDLGYYTRPQLRAFVTLANWNEEQGNLAGAGYKADNTSATTYGVQMEVWW